ncbi:MAG: BrnT family toxin [Desulfovibrio sp.]|nr:MAG: BrnT family toxin [Desulfovibrio sp.]
MEIEWDEIKRFANLRKHGYDLAEAGMVFETPYLIDLDLRRDYGEDRWIVLGYLKGDLIVLVYTDRGEKARIISLRKATLKERRIYEKRITYRL